MTLCGLWYVSTRLCCSEPSALFLTSFTKGKDSVIHGMSPLLILFPNLLAAKMNSHCLNFPFSPLPRSVLEALLNKSGGLLTNPFLLSAENVCHSLPKAHYAPTPLLLYYSKLAKETTIQSKTCSIP